MASESDNQNGGTDSQTLPFLNLALKLLQALNPENLKQPQTFFDQFADELRTELSQVSDAANAMGPEEVSAFVARSLGPFFIEVMKQNERELESKVLHDPEIGALIDLMEGAHRAVPMSPAQIVTHMNDIGWQVAIAKPMEHLVDAKRLTGEQQSSATLRFLQSVCSNVYEPYVRAIWSLLQTCKKGAVKAHAGKFGAVLSDVCNNFELNGVPVESDMAWFRNAAAHGNSRYLPHTGELEIWDDKKPPTRFLASQLIGRGEAAYVHAVSKLGDAHSLFVARHGYLQSSLSEKIAELAPKAVDPDPAVREPAARELLAVFEPVRASLPTSDPFWGPNPVNEDSPPPAGGNEDE